MDRIKVQQQREQFPQVEECISLAVKAGAKDARPGYQYLYERKEEIPKELYAYYFRMLLQMNTNNVSAEMRLEMFRGVAWEDIMYQDEIDAIRDFPDFITVYRGTHPGEEKPGLSWSLYRWVAEGSDFYQGRLFRAVIPKSSILLYFAREEDEGEIIAHVISGFEVIEPEK